MAENDRERDDATGQYTPTVPDEDLLEAVREHEPAGTSEVGEAVGLARQNADYRLRKLESADEVKKKKIGRSLAWSIASSADTESGEEFTTRSSEPDNQGSAAESSSLTDVDFPSGRDRADCEAAIYAARDHLQDNGPASMRELVVAVMPEYPIGYEVPEIDDGELVADRYRGAWWRKVVKPGLQTLPDVEAPAGGGKWRYTGE